MALDLLLGGLPVELVLRFLVLVCVSFLQNQFFRFFDDSSIECSIVVLYVSLGLVLELLLAEVHRQTDLKQILSHCPFGLYIAYCVLSGMFFVLKFFCKCSEISSLVTGKVLLRYSGQGMLLEWLYS